MDPVHEISHPVARRDVDRPPCETSNAYNGHLELRIASIFIIWFASTLGACFPVYANRHRGLGVPSWVFFTAKFFGSGVIISTAFIHLLDPAEDAFRNPCLTGPITNGDWVSRIILMTIFVLFFIELMVMRQTTAIERSPSSPTTEGPVERVDTYQLGHDHLGHLRDHNDMEDASRSHSHERYKAQLATILIHEFGIIFHSVFIGLTLSVAGDQFITLFIVLIFHQAFEGLGLGARLAVAPWPRAKRETAYLLGAAYGISTPIAIIVGLGVRKSYPPEGRTTLIVSGIFNSISAGILIYTGLVELMAHEFMFSTMLRNGPLKTLLMAFGCMTLGALLMAILGEWS